MRTQGSTVMITTRLQEGLNMAELRKALIQNHERSIRVLKDELNKLYARDNQNGTNSRDEANEILEDIKGHRELIKALEAAKQT